MGLMWGNGESSDALVKSLRDTCEKDDDIKFGWTVYDTRSGGIQTINDTSIDVDVTTSFIKTPDGKSWGVRVDGAPKRRATKTAVIFHLALEDMPDPSAAESPTKYVRCEPADTPAGNDQVIAVCTGEDPSLGGFEIQVINVAQGNIVEGPAIKSIQVPESSTWQAKSVLTSQIKAASSAAPGGAGLPSGHRTANMHFLQAVFEGPFEIDLIYYSKSTTKTITSANFAGKVDEIRTMYQQRINNVFPWVAPYHPPFEPEHVSFEQSLLSNLLGGLGYFHGDSKVDLTHAKAYEEEKPDFWKDTASAMAQAEITTAEPTSLLSHTPSRSSFARGFLWDEGFHLLPVVEWDLDLAVSVLRSWYNLMDSDGWIAREQILGPEARSKVPEEFQVQYPHHANPLTFTALVLPMILDKIDNQTSYLGRPSQHLASPETSEKLLRELYPLLVRQYDWFRRTQAGDFSDAYTRPNETIPDEGYRWRGRTPELTLTSGLDDSPRANVPHPAELHVDALSWVGASARTLTRIAKYLGEDGDAKMYGKQAKNIEHNLDVLHYDPVGRIYCDSTVLFKSDSKDDSKDETKVDPKGEYKQVCHIGYISLIPFLTGHLGADHPNLNAVLGLLNDPNKIWSPYGIRSLSIKEDKYGQGDDYWRGAVWMNINVLAVLRLNEIGRWPGKEQKWVQKLAQQLRRRILAKVFDSWYDTGFVWEQYSDVTGHGRRGKGFTGWTASLLLLMRMDDTPYPVVENPGTWTPGRVIALVLFLVAAVAGIVTVAIRRGLLDRFGWVMDKARERFNIPVYKQLKGDVY
ncbi:putative mannosyl-oligosaccharide glucosidase protein [Phaeoacremonium minimum UCRPA7]|uniref:Mannosyl-oligosaccharide glucosidase n=1 Tax=Phaeoacremonium minimum (strain UCR-PA7) TaxID=1286976 RepID=R8BCC9_PHAM7|nr:putative mannosyl-oligosaccharide glucosidase protein [Phaeoacremonium minimum UCRPA7]EON96956.1 putative mannosyl-oligosaccharide glucosidase protein [Phaeoacremonium minimum UCRPA7]